MSLYRGQQVTCMEVWLLPCSWAALRPSLGFCSPECCGVSSWLLCSLTLCQCVSGAIVWCVGRTAGVLDFSLFLFKKWLFSLSQQGIQSQWICQLTTKGTNGINAFIFAFIVKTHPSVISHLLTRLASCSCMPAWIFWFLAEPSWWPRGLVPRLVVLNSHRLRISQTISSGAKPQSLTLTQKRQRQHRRSGSLVRRHKENSRIFVLNVSFLCVLFINHCPTFENISLLRVQKKWFAK